MYEQIITSVYGAKHCKDMGFANGTKIHSVSGLTLNVKKINGNLTIVCLSTIPHINSLRALGTSNNIAPANDVFFEVASPSPTAKLRDLTLIGNTQKTNLRFPAARTTLSILWPHFTIHTLTKTENDE